MYRAAPTRTALQNSPAVAIRPHRATSAWPSEGARLKAPITSQTIGIPTHIAISLRSIGVSPQAWDYATESSVSIFRGWVRAGGWVEDAGRQIVVVRLVDLSGVVLEDRVEIQVALFRSYRPVIFPVTVHLIDATDLISATHHFP